VLDFPDDAVPDRLKYARHGQRTGRCRPSAFIAMDGRMMTFRKFLLWFAAGLLLFAIGQRFSATANDFIVYHTAAKSFLEGRTDLYSDSFALKPPMIYVYPPLFLLVVSPIGCLNFETAYGLWFALMAVSFAAIVRSAVSMWWPRNRIRYACMGILICAPYVILCFRSGNVHLFVVLLTVLAFLAWSYGNYWKASFALAIGGAIKLFPLFLIPMLLIRREWRLLVRTVGLTVALWLLPIVYFGPQQTIVLYRAWYGTVIGDIGNYKLQRAVDQSMNGSLERWLTSIDYSQYADSDYPPANFADLSKPGLKIVNGAFAAAVVGLSLWMCFNLGVTVTSRKNAVATVGAIFITAQLLLGPYTPIQYLSGWLLAVLTLPAVLRRDFVERILFCIGFVNALLFAIPGRMSQRTLQAYGAFTVIGIVLWILSMLAARRVRV
jgi:hypothetical protein